MVVVTALEKLAVRKTVESDEQRVNDPKIAYLNISKMQYLFNQLFHPFEKNRIVKLLSIWMERLTFI